MALSADELATRDVIDSLLVVDGVLDEQTYDVLLGYFAESLASSNEPEFTGYESSDGPVTAEEEQEAWESLSVKERALAMSPLELNKECRQDGVWQKVYDLPTILAGTLEKQDIFDGIEKLFG